MTSLSPSSEQPGTEDTRELLEILGADQLTSLIGLGADIVFLVDGGVVTHAQYQNRDFDAYSLADFVGKALRDCVTIESIPKIDAMLGSGPDRPPRGYQVNHRASGHPDLPVAYTAHCEQNRSVAIVVGREMRQQMQDQQRLVEAQIAMEADYRALRQAEARYRTAFKLAETADIMLDGEKRTVLEANSAAIELLTGGSRTLIKKPVRDLFAKGERDRLADAIAEARHSGEPVTLASIKGAKGGAFQVKLRAYRDNGVANLLLTLWPAQDGTHLTEHTPDESAPAPAANLLEILPEAAILTGIDGNVIAANAAFLDLVQAPTANQVLGRNASTWLGKSTADLNVLYARLRDERTVRGYSANLSDTLGGDQPVSVSAQHDPGSDTVQLLLLPEPTTEERMGVQAQSTAAQAEGFASLVGKVPLKELIRESLDVVEKICIEAALDQTRNNRASAAEILGLSRQSLYIKLRRHGLENYRPGS